MFSRNSKFKKVTPKSTSPREAISDAKVKKAVSNLFKGINLQDVFSPDTNGSNGHYNSKSFNGQDNNRSFGSHRSLNDSLKVKDDQPKDYPDMSMSRLDSTERKDDEKVEKKQAENVKSKPLIPVVSTSVSEKSVTSILTDKVVDSLDQEMNYLVMPMSHIQARKDNQKVEQSVDLSESSNGKMKKLVSNIFGDIGYDMMDINLKLDQEQPSFQSARTVVVPQSPENSHEIKSFNSHDDIKTSLEDEFNYDLDSELDNLPISMSQLDRVIKDEEESDSKDKKTIVRDIFADIGYSLDGIDLDFRNPTFNSTCLFQSAKNVLVNDAKESSVTFIGDGDIDPVGDPDLHNENSNEHEDGMNYLTMPMIQKPSLETCSDEKEELEVENKIEKEVIPRFMSSTPDFLSDVDDDELLLSCAKSFIESDQLEKEKNELNDDNELLFMLRSDYSINEEERASSQEVKSINSQQYWKILNESCVDVGAGDVSIGFRKSRDLSAIEYDETKLDQAKNLFQDIEINIKSLLESNRDDLTKTLDNSLLFRSIEVRHNADIIASDSPENVDAQNVDAQNVDAQKVNAQKVDEIELEEKMIDKEGIAKKNNSPFHAMCTRANSRQFENVSNLLDSKSVVKNQPVRTHPTRKTRIGTEIGIIINPPPSNSSSRRSVPTPYTSTPNRTFEKRKYATRKTQSFSKRLKDL